MAGKNWYFDCYDFRKYSVGEIDTFIDIGGNNGSVSMMMKILQPRAKFVVIEPCIENFKDIQKKLLCWRGINIDAYNVAFGDGNLMCFKRSGHAGMHKFYSEKEKEMGWWPENYEYTVESKTLSQIFSDYNVPIDKSYIIKMDIEGGERFVLEQEEETLGLFRGSVQVSMELHLGLGGTGEQWNNFFQKLADTHELRIGGYTHDKRDPKAKYMFTTASSFLGTSGFHTVELVNRDWTGPFPGRGK